MTVTITDVPLFYTWNFPCSVLITRKAAKQPPSWEDDGDKMTELSADHAREKACCAEKLRSHHTIKDLIQAGMTGRSSERGAVQKGL